MIRFEWVITIKYLWSLSNWVKSCLRYSLSPPTKCGFILGQMIVTISQIYFASQLSHPTSKFPRLPDSKFSQEFKKRGTLQQKIGGWPYCILFVGFIRYTTNPLGGEGILGKKLDGLSQPAWSTRSNLFFWKRGWISQLYSIFYFIFLQSFYENKLMHSC